MKYPKNSKFILNDCILDYSELSNYSTKNTMIIYEVVRVINKKLLFIEDHLNRFVQSAELININLELTQKEIYDHLKRLIDVNNLINENIKFEVQIDEQKGKQNFLAYTIPHYYPTKDEYLEGVNVSLLRATRTNPNAKIQDLSIRELSNQVLKENHVFEVILVNENGYVTEGSRSNIFAIKGGVVKTPQTEEILPGITREYVIKICDKLNIKCIQTKISIDELLTMDALFVTGTSPKVLPIKRVDELSFSTKNRYLNDIMERYDQTINEYLKNKTILD